MTHILVIQGAGMDRRGKEHVDIFGPETLEEINTSIASHAAALNVTVNIVQHNAAADVLNALQHTSEFDAVIINPAGFMAAPETLPETLGELDKPVYEVHASNPAARNIASPFAGVCTGFVCGFGYAGYRVLLDHIATGPR